MRERFGSRPDRAFPDGDEGDHRHGGDDANANGSAVCDIHSAPDRNTDSDSYSDGNTPDTRTPERFTYSFLDESRLTYKFTTRGDQRELLTRGSMEVVAREHATDEAFEFEITRFDFEAGRFHLTGHEGSLRTTTPNGTVVLSMRVLVDVSGGQYFAEAVELSSCGPPSYGRFSGYPPRLQELVICGGKSEILTRRFSLIVVMFAEPVG